MHELLKWIREDGEESSGLAGNNLMKQHRLIDLIVAYFAQCGERKIDRDIGENEK